jgi:hypothetical protein
MTTVRVDEAGIRSVINALESAAGEARSTSAFLATHGLGAAALATLTGHGLAAGVLVARMEGLAVSAASHAHELHSDAQVTGEWGNALIGSQVFRTSGTDWAGIAHDGKGLLSVGWSERKWFKRLAHYVHDKSLLSHSRTWTKFGDYGRVFSRTGSSLLGLAGTVAGSVVGGAAGGFIGSAGDAVTSVWGFGTLHLHPQTYARFLGTKAAGKALLPLAALEIGTSIHSLATTDYQDLVHGDAQGHSDTTRNVIYSAKVIDTVGTAGIAIGLATANPIVLGVGLTLTGVSAITRGTIFASDYLHEHDVTVKSATRVLSSLTPDWPHIRTPHLPAWSL